MQPKNVLTFAPKPSEIQALIHRLAMDSKNVRWKAAEYETHAEGRMDLRDIEDKTMFEVLRTGYVKGGVEPGRNPGEWKVKMCKKIKGMREVGVVTVVINMSKLFVKTVEWEDPK
jgi:hypothetical protein